LNGVILFKLNKKIETVLQATYQNYTMDTCKIAWNKEKFNMSLTTKYNYDTKLSFNLKVYFVGTRKGLSEQAAFSAVNPQNYSDVLLGNKRYYDTRYVIYDLPAYVDANIGAEYRHTKKLSAFLTLNNLLNARIQRWQHIPTMGFWLMAGATYSF
jgi:hypothetical protein